MVYGVYDHQHTKPRETWLKMAVERHNFIYAHTYIYGIKNVTLH